MNPSTSPERQVVIKDGVKAVFKVGMGNGQGSNLQKM